jgi:ribosomal protein L28
MSLRCELTGKTSRKSASRSHSNIKTLRRQFANLQWKTIDGVRMFVSARAIKTLKKNKIKA